VESVRALGQALSSAKPPRRVWLQASTATIYAHTYDVPNAEVSGVIGGAGNEEREASVGNDHQPRSWGHLRYAAGPRAERPGRNLGRRASVCFLDSRGGLYPRDLLLIEHDDMDGAVNLASPNPVTNREFMTGLRRAWGASIGLPSAKWMLDLGAIFLRTETELILKSRRVFPGRLLRGDFRLPIPIGRKRLESCANGGRLGFSAERR
jgi:hypothetical protein